MQNEWDLDYEPLPAPRVRSEVILSRAVILPRGSTWARAEGISDHPRLTRALKRIVAAAFYGAVAIISAAAAVIIFFLAKAFWTA